MLTYLGNFLLALGICVALSIIVGLAGILVLNIDTDDKADDLLDHKEAMLYR